MVRVRDEALGDLELEVHVDRRSSVDSFASAGFSRTLNRELSEQELELANERFTAEVQEYAYANGSHNHN